MNTLPYQATIATRMSVSAEHTIAPDAQFYQTENGYWIAWQENIAAVLPPNLPDDEPCDWVEGMDSLVDLRDLIESGEYEQMLAQEDEHQHTCGCGCAHG